jgi:hypothetical protein
MASTEFIVSTLNGPSRLLFESQLSPLECREVKAIIDDVDDLDELLAVAKGLAEDWGIRVSVESLYPFWALN